MATTAGADGEAGQDTRLGYGEGRDALLIAAVRVVARDGLRKLTYRAVAAEAGVTHGLVAHHFGPAGHPARRGTAVVRHPQHRDLFTGSGQRKS
ncbi:TetR family transcriptional regulator [Streptomyces sp. T028]|uniref:TetR family transcriptional regulator n=1 Tax=Streptomyces sp. T028 TaxID=3394379 RepID=UPI003A86257F